MATQKVTKNRWYYEKGKPFFKARILSHEIHPEGLDIDRIRFFEPGSFSPDSTVGHVISVLRGRGSLHVAGSRVQSFHLEAGVHLYLPPGMESTLDAEPGTEIMHVSSASDSQARGKQLLLRDEEFLAASAVGSELLRWVLTPQYLSRRIFLHHDQTLLSRSGNPVSWFRTTMFDVAGLPGNEDGEPVFKMSYNSRTECNVCYDVSGTARVRMAIHPYRQAKQLWDPWFLLDGESTYHLNEAAGSPEEECLVDPVTGVRQLRRNKHEIHIAEGYVTLFCLFDPAPTGIERHVPGEYSDYEPLSKVLQSNEYEKYRRELTTYDEMLDRLSAAKALGKLEPLRGSLLWALYEKGRAAQVAIECELAQALVGDGKARDRVLAHWMQAGSIDVG